MGFNSVLLSSLRLFVCLFVSPALGSIMEEYAMKYLGVKMSTFIPKHTRNLGNEFRCFVNYDSGLNSDSVS